MFRDPEDFGRMGRSDHGVLCGKGPLFIYRDYSREK
jgi:hypothetical protein